MKNVGAYEAKTHLPQLLDQVAKGERITITKHGVPVAMLVPASARGRHSLQDAIASMKEFGKGRRLGRKAIRSMIEEGRR